MNLEIHDPYVIRLLMILDHDDWFEILRLIADRFNEIGEEGYRDRVEDLIRYQCRPILCSDFNGMTSYAWEYKIYDQDSLVMSYQTVRSMSYINRGSFTRSIRQQLLAYLQVPDYLRVKKKGLPDSVSF